MVHSRQIVVLGRKSGESVHDAGSYFAPCRKEGANFSCVESAAVHGFGLEIATTRLLNKRMKNELEGKMKPELLESVYGVWKFSFVENPAARRLPSAKVLPIMNRGITNTKPKTHEGQAPEETQIIIQDRVSNTYTTEPSWMLHVRSTRVTNCLERHAHLSQRTD